jgi:DNA sulfur modification protein DndE
MAAIESVRISEKGKNQLSTLKRRTGIPTWNILCRWAFCISVGENTPPRQDESTGEHPIEMTWKTFAGEHDKLYLALLKNRCRKDGLELDGPTLSRQLRLHIHRGIGYLVGDPNLQSIADLLEKSMNGNRTGSAA